MPKKKLTISPPPRLVNPSSFQLSSPPPNAQMDQFQPHHFNFSEFDRINLIGHIDGHPVYKVSHRLTGTLYALMVFTVNDLENPFVVRRVCREVQLMRELDHPNIVKCHDFLLGQQNGQSQVLLDLMDGVSLAGICITNESHLSSIARQVLMALAYIHGRKIVHRNINPSNILTDTTRNFVKITNFGVSRIIGATVDPNDVMAAIKYCSPEKINTDSSIGVYNAFSADIWSFGLSVLEVYLGRFPIVMERDWDNLVNAICMSPLPVAPVSASAEFQDFIGCCLQRDQGRRWSAEELLQHPFIVNKQLHR